MVSLFGNVGDHGKLLNFLGSLSIQEPLVEGPYQPTKRSRVFETSPCYVSCPGCRVCLGFRVQGLEFQGWLAGLKIGFGVRSFRSSPGCCARVVGCVACKDFWVRV